MLELIKAGGLLMWPIMLCSVIALAIIAERFWSLQRKRICPGNLVAEVWLWHKNGQLTARRIQALKSGSQLGRILAAGLVNRHYHPQPVFAYVPARLVGVARHTLAPVAAVHSWDSPKPVFVSSPCSRRRARPLRFLAAAGSMHRAVLHLVASGHVNQPLGNAVHHAMYCAKMCLSCADACMAEAIPYRHMQGFEREVALPTAVEVEGAGPEGYAPRRRRRG